MIKLLLTCQIMHYRHHTLQQRCKVWFLLDVARCPNELVVEQTRAMLLCE
jgi:hypothetical protein